MSLRLLLLFTMGAAGHPTARRRPRRGAVPRPALGRRHCRFRCLGALAPMARAPSPVWRAASAPPPHPRRGAGPPRFGGLARPPSPAPRPAPLRRPCPPPPLKQRAPRAAQVRLLARGRPQRQSRGGARPPGVISNALGLQNRRAKRSPGLVNARVPSKPREHARRSPGAAGQTRRLVCSCVFASVACVSVCVARPAHGTAVLSERLWPAVKFSLCVAQPEARTGRGRAPGGGAPGGKPPTLGTGVG